MKNEATLVRKAIIVRFEFTPDEWAEIKKHYKDDEVRQILIEGGIGELNILLDGRGAEDHADETTKCPHPDCESEEPHNIKERDVTDWCRSGRKTMEVMCDDCFDELCDTPTVADLDYQFGSDGW